MNKTAIKNFAVWARTTLLTAVKQKAFEYEITEDGEMDVHLTAIEGRLLTEEEKKQRRELIDKIKEDGYEQVMEQTAYIWFNRFIALRFMEVNGYLPSRVRVFTDDSGEFRPAILKEAMNLELDGLDREKVYGYLEEQNNEELYKYLLLTQCNALNKCLPYMFEKIDNYTELLFPSGLLKADSVIGRMISEIPEEDWSDQVQIIGWLYQYYNSELKDDTFAKLKKNTKISKDRIPAATQLFTPNWIVRYMVENSLGRLWLEGHPNDSLKAEWKYYLEEAEQEPEVEAQLLEIRREYQNIKLEEIKVIDPCMGSGHILVAAFDVLMKIYTSCGWSERDAAKSIVENNLYGLDIDDRAGQLAYFSVMMEARKYNRRALNGDLEPKVMAIEETKFMTGEMISYVANGDKALQEDLTYLKTVFDDGKEYGSILTVKSLDFDRIYSRLSELEAVVPENLLDQLVHDQALSHLKPIIMQAELLSGKFDAVITNPPYMGLRKMNRTLAKEIEDRYTDEKYDFFSVFIKRNIDMTVKHGMAAYMTPNVWLYIASYEKMRRWLIEEMNFMNSIVLPDGEFKDAGVNIIGFVIRKAKLKKYRSCIIKECTEKEYFADISPKSHCQITDTFLRVPKCRFLVPEKVQVEDIINTFTKGISLDLIGKPRQGMATSDNDRFTRLWNEVEYSKIQRNAINGVDFVKKWAPYNKGGGTRKWYGNSFTIVNWENNGYLVKGYATELYGSASRTIKNEKYYFKEGITYSFIGKELNPRISPTGSVFDVAGSMIFSETKLLYLLGLLASKVVVMYMNFFNPTLNSQVGDIKEIPIVFEETRYESIIKLVNSSIDYAEKDWNSYETSWDFKKNPLV